MPKKKAKHAIVKRAEPQPLAVTIPEQLERTLIAGDLSPLAPEDRVKYYNAVCKSLALNPLTKPFDYIAFRQFDDDSSASTLQLYANKSCSEQLRKLHGVSLVQWDDKTLVKRWKDEHFLYSEVMVRDRSGRMESGLGVVPLEKIKKVSGNYQTVKLSGRELANAIMKCDTKAKRRATLAICGLAFMDESELDGVQVVGGVTKEGRVYYHQQPDEREKLIENKKAELTEKIDKQKEAGAETREPGDEPTEQGFQADKPNLVIDHTDEMHPIVRGDLLQLSGVVATFCTRNKENTEWVTTPRQVEMLRREASKGDFTVTEIMPPSEPKSQPGAHSGSGTSGAAERTAPELVWGMILKCTPSITNNQHAMLTVKMEVEGKVPSYGCFVEPLFEWLQKGVGKKCAVYVAHGKAKYLNIVGLHTIAGTEFDTDMRTPIVQRDREAGSLFKG